MRESEEHETALPCDYSLRSQSFTVFALTYVSRTTATLNQGGKDPRISQLTWIQLVPNCGSPVTIIGMSSIQESRDVRDVLLTTAVLSTLSPGLTLVIQTAAIRHRFHRVSLMLIGKSLSFTNIPWNSSCCSCTNLSQPILRWFPSLDAYSWYRNEQFIYCNTSYKTFGCETRWKLSFWEKKNCFSESSCKKLSSSIYLHR
jgi:hypothetical protein